MSIFLHGSGGKKTKYASGTKSLGVVSTASISVEVGFEPDFFVLEWCNNYSKSHETFIYADGQASYLYSPYHSNNIRTVSHKYDDGIFTIGTPGTITNQYNWCRWFAIKM